MTTANPASNGSEFTARLQGILLRQETILFFILIGGMIFMSFQSDVFLTPQNLLNQGRLATEIALIALPMTLIIITGGIDLSVGSIVGLTAIMLGVAWENWGLPLEVAIGVALLIATACGAFNAFFIIRVGLPPLITTLATLALFRGLAEGIAQARSVRGYPEWFYIWARRTSISSARPRSSPTSCSWWSSASSCSGPRWPGRPSADRSTPSAATRRAPASAAWPWPATSSSSTPSRASCPGWRAGSSSPG